MNVIRQEGLLGLNHGLTAAVLRQLTYSTTRFAVYEVSMTLCLFMQGTVSSHFCNVCVNKCWQWLLSDVVHLQNNGYTN